MKVVAFLVGILVVFGVLGAWGARHASHNAAGALERAWQGVGGDVASPHLDDAWKMPGRTCLEYQLSTNHFVVLCFRSDGALTEAFNATLAGIRIDTVIPDASAAPVRVPGPVLSRAVSRIWLAHLRETATDISDRAQRCIANAKVVGFTPKTVPRLALTRGVRRLAYRARATCASESERIADSLPLAGRSFPSFLPTIRAFVGLTAGTETLTGKLAARRLTLDQYRERLAVLSARERRLLRGLPQRTETARRAIVASA